MASDTNFDRTRSVGHGPQGAAKNLTGQILLNYWMDLLQIFRNYFLGFLYLHDTPLSVCLYVCQSKNLTGHLLLNYWMDLLQIFRNYFLGSLYLHVLPLSVCLSVKILDRTSPLKLLDGFTLTFQEPLFVRE